MIGRTLCHYQITEKLGAGGMGEVYRAADTKLGRDVAIKVLPPHFAKDPERLARFEREARVLAQLNHPNIAAIYGIEQADGVHFLVLEYVPGPTLAELIAKGPLEPQSWLQICNKLVDALEAAHEKSFVHRDLKPANIKVTPDDQVKLLDFGLAKAWTEERSGDQSQSPTLSIAATRAGTLLGTAAYMSPEQARGQPVDKRADVWAFGCVLYEMVTSGKAFGGDSIMDIIGAVAGKEPNWAALPAGAPERMLRRCLEKDPKRRLRDIGDARMLLEEPQPAPVAVARAPARRWGIVPLVAALVAGVAVWLLKPAPPRAVVRLAVVLPAEVALRSGARHSVAFSPTGKHIVFAGRAGAAQLYLRAIDRAESQPIAGAEGADMPFFSPDGQWIAFFADGKLKKVPITGGPPTVLCDAPAPWGASWGPDDRILFNPTFGAGLHRVPAAGGKPEVVTTADLKQGPGGHRWPFILPGGKAAVFTINTRAANFHIGLVALDTGKWQTLIDNGTQPQYSPSGHLVFQRGDALMAAPFDLARLRVTGQAAPVLERVARNAVTGAAQFSVSGDGSVVYMAGAAGFGRALVWVNRQGVARPLGDLRRDFREPRLSPDGKRLAATASPDDIWVYAMTRGVLSRLTFEAGEDESPIWSPDGRRIAFAGDRPKRQIFWKPADGSGSEEALATLEQHAHLSSWSRDGKRIAYAALDPATGWDIWVLPLEDRKPQPFLRTPFEEIMPAFSPDGRWLAYNSNESGRPEVYVRPVSGEGGKWQISADGGLEPLWAPNGRELFYRNGEQVLAAQVEAGPAFRAGKPRLLFAGPYVSGVTESRSRHYDIAPDGREFVMVKETAEGATQIQVVLNFAEELKRRAGAQ